ncbi:MAG: restriction endonuclease subunit S [Candidatus Absconditabacteria bacterium]
MLTNKIKKYDKYKDSGIPWIGEIPSQWEVKKIKYIGKTLAGGTPSTTVLEYWENGNIPWLLSGVVQNNIIYEANISKFITDLGLISSATKLIKPYSVLVALTGATCGNVAYLTFGSSANQSVVGIHQDKNTISKFLFYSMLDNREQIILHKSGGAQGGVNESNIKNLFMSCPTFQEQQGIADFLDKKTAQIDMIIERRKKQIELLKEKRVAIINRAVTKGLDNSVKMKDSGIEWIGEIPEHWEVKSPYRVCKVIRGNCSFKKDELKSQGEYIALQYGKVYKVEVVDDNYEFYVNKEFYKYNQIIKKGDTILVSTSETMEDLGHSCYYNREEIGLLGGEQLCLKPNNQVKDKFLYYASRYFKYELNQYAGGLKVYRFKADDLKKIGFILPPFDKQIEIIEFLDNKIPLIDKSIEKLKKSLGLFEEYKKSLISNVVTGKIKVF